MRIALYNRRLATLGGGERHGLALAQSLSRAHEVTLFGDAHLDETRSLLPTRLGLTLDRVNWQSIATREAQSGDFTRGYDLFVNASHGDFIPPRARRNAMLVFFPLAPPLGPVARADAHLRYGLGRAMNRLPGPLYERLVRDEALHGRLQNLIPPRFLSTVQRYDVLWANSRFTQRWIERRWGRASEVLYPPVDVETFRVGAAPLLKQPQILSVGRFFAGHHNKQHLLLIRAFQALVDGGLRGWTLHLAGGTNSSPTHQVYLKRVRAAAEGYPITLHADVSLDELVHLYQTSAIYWHASGAGEDEDAPETFEHFGLTTVEAMAAGCVPVVIGRGGQPEVVEAGQSGFLWQDVDEFKRQTQQLIADPSLRREMSLAAQARAQRFDQRHFEQRVAALIDQLA